MKLVTAVTLAVAVTGPATASGQGVEVGVVAEYRPANGRFVFDRGSDKVPVLIGTVVRTGDRVTLPPGAEVIVQLATGKPLSLKETTAVPTSPPLGPVARFLRSIGRLFDDEFRQSRVAGSRCGKCDPKAPAPPPLAIPLLETEARVLAGPRDLPVTWLGGCGPYAVALLRGYDTVAARRNVETDRVRLDSLSLAPGRFRVVVTDGGGRRVEGAFEVVSKLPSPPDELARDRTELGTIAQAVWLAEQEQGRWRLDAFERLRPLIRSGNPLAGSLADGILWGRRAAAKPR